MRELENTIERAVVLSRGATIGVKDLQLEPRRTTATMSAVSASDSMIGMPAFGAAVEQAGITLPPDLSLEEAERRYAKAILEREGGNQSAAARALGISRNKLARLLKAE